MNEPIHTEHRALRMAGANSGRSGREGAILGVVMVVLVVVSFMGVGLLNLNRAAGWEAGRSVSDAWMERLQRGGVAVLLLMMSIALFNDLTRLFG